MSRVLLHEPSQDVAIVRVDYRPELHHVAITRAREVIREAAEHPMRQSLRLERLLASLILDTPERKQRVASFLDRKASKT